MFTGIIKAVGSVRQVQRTGGDMRLGILAEGIRWQRLKTGDSISVNGVCLTAVQLHEDGFDADVSLETLDVTALSGLHSGDRVNIEPALTVGEALGGHLVSGHVDCVGSIRKCRSDARSSVLTIEIPVDYARYVAKKGSVCVDGVSLTINEVSTDAFEVNIIPHTAQVTIIGDYQVGTRVNIEVDLLARYLERLLGQDSGGISKEFLRANGYA